LYYRISYSEFYQNLTRALKIEDVIDSRCTAFFRSWTTLKNTKLIAGQFESFISSGVNSGYIFCN